MILIINEYSEYMPLSYFLEPKNTFNSDGKRIFKFWKNLFKELDFKDWNLQKLGKYYCEHNDFKTVDIIDSNIHISNIRVTYCQDCAKIEEYQEFTGDKYNADN